MEGLNAAGLRMSYSDKYLIFNTKKIDEICSDCLILR